MQGTLHYFTGENAYAIREEKRMWEEQFRLRHGMVNLATLEGSTLRFGELLDQVSMAPFLSQKRLFMIEGTPTFQKEEIELLAKTLHPDSVVVVIDATPDKRLSSVKTFLKVATVKNFPKHRPAALRGWMAQKAKEHGSFFTPRSDEALLQIAGEDQDVLSTEIEKHSLYAGARGISAEDISLLAVPSAENEVWHLTSLLAAGRKREALSYLEHLLEGGEDPMGLWSILLWMLRCLVSVAAACQEGQKQPARIASLFHIAPSAVSNLLPLANAISIDALGELVSWAAAAEVDLKTGALRYTREAAQELTTLLECFIMRVCNLTVVRA